METSQRNADLVFRAMASAAPGRVPAAAGGSMNNVMIGGMSGAAPWAFYETIGVGLGGSSRADGIDGIQANMTNTLNTPVEAIERTLPLRIVRYEFRRDSSGAGRHRGGSGIVRSYQATADGTSFTILAERRRHRPWGLEGGSPGGGTTVVVVRKGRRVEVPVKTTLTLAAGDTVEVMTAGGGGFGDPRARPSGMVRRDVENGLLTPEKASLDYHIMFGSSKGGRRAGRIG